MRPPRASILSWASRKGVHWAAAPVRNMGLSPASARRRQSAKASAPCCPARTYWRETGYVCQEKRRSEEHTSELQSLMRISYAVFCLKKKKIMNKIQPQKYKH